MLSADGGRFRPGRTSVNTSTARRRSALEVHVRTAAHDLHSGRYGGAVGNAAMVLARLLATLHDDKNRIAVAGFFDGLQRPGNADLSPIHALGLDEAAFLAEVGARVGAIEPGVPLLEALWFRPTIEVNGITAGYQGAGGKTVIPCVASAKLTCRLGLGQQPAHVAAAVTAHLHAHCPPWADLRVENPNDGAAAYAVPPDDPFLCSGQPGDRRRARRAAGARRHRRHAAGGVHGQTGARAGDGDALRTPPATSAPMRPTSSFACPASTTA